MNDSMKQSDTLLHIVFSLSRKPPGLFEGRLAVYREPPGSSPAWPRARSGTFSGNEKLFDAWLLLV